MVVLPRRAAAYGCAIASQVWPEELHLRMTETDKMLAGEALVDLLRRGEAERVADLLLSLGLGLPRFRLLQ